MRWPERSGFSTTIVCEDVARRTGSAAGAGSSDALAVAPDAAFVAAVLAALAAFTVLAAPFAASPESAVDVLADSSSAGFAAAPRRSRASRSGNADSVAH